MWMKPGVVVLMRDASTVQVGLSRPLIVQDLTDAQIAFVAGLENATAPVSTSARRRFADLIELLAGHGVLESERVSPFADATVRVHGLGAVGASVALTLARAGVGSLGLVDESPSHHELPGTYGVGGPRTTCAAAAAWMLRERTPDVRLAASFESADVEVMVCHGAVPAHQAAVLVYADVPHVPVVSDEDGVTVGPAVVPGVTACVRCWEVARINRDPLWPRLAMQCAGSRRPRLGAVASETAAALAAAQVLAIVRGDATGADDSPVAHGWRVDGATGVPRPVPRVAPHPECGCGAAGLVGDEVAARRAAMRTLVCGDDLEDL